MNDDGCSCPGMRMPPCGWCCSRYLCPECEDIIGSVDDYEDGELCEKCDAKKLKPADFDAFEVTLAAAIVNDPLVISQLDAHVGSVVGAGDERYNGELKWIADHPEVIKIERPSLPNPGAWVDRLGALAMILVAIYFLLLR